MSEEVVWSGGLAPLSLYWYWILGLLTVWILGLGLVFIILGLLKMNRWKYELTTERLKVRYGFLSTTRREADLDRIQDVVIHQSFVGKILGYGSLYFNTSGTSGYEIIFDDVSNPEALKERFRELRNTKQGE